MAGIIVEDVSFISEGFNLKGRIYRPVTEKKYPGVLICHGYPGDVKNMDLAEDMALNGYAVMIFYYRGAWSSEGEYRTTYTPTCTRDALKYLRSLPFVDEKRVGMVSHSMGSVPLTKIMSQDRNVKAGVLMSPISGVDKWASAETLDIVTPVFMKMAKGKLRGMTEERFREDVVETAIILNPNDNVPLIHVPLLFIVGTADTVATQESFRLLYNLANEPKKWIEIEDADHGYSEHRWPLISAVLNWLNYNL